MKMSMTHATIERNAAMQEMKKLHKKTNLMEKELEQVRVHVSQERSISWKLEQVLLVYSH